MTQNSFQSICCWKGEHIDSHGPEMRPDASCLQPCDGFPCAKKAWCQRLSIVGSVRWCECAKVRTCAYSELTHVTARAAAHFPMPPPPPPCHGATAGTAGTGDTSANHPHTTRHSGGPV